MRTSTRRSLAAAAGYMGLLVLLTMLPVAAQPAGDADDLAALRRHATDLLLEGRLAEATSFAEQARDLAQRRLDPRDPELAETLCDLAFLYLKLGRHGDAEFLSARALAIYDGSPARPAGNLWSVMRLLAQAYTKQGRAADAEAALARMRAIERAVSVWFEVEIALPAELITTDLKRLSTRDCGVVTFEVDDPQALLRSYQSFARVQLHARLEIGSALRQIVGSRSSAQVLGEAEQIGREFKASLNKSAFGYSVRAMPENIASCLRRVPPPAP
jgi:tetratricopeptide (TPR) repeat protein